MSAPPAGERLTLMVCDDGVDLFARVVHAMAGTGAAVQRLRSFPEKPLVRSGEQVIALASVTLLAAQGDAYRSSDLPIIWIGTVRHDPQTLDPTGGRQLLAVDFTDAELQAMVGKVRPLKRAEDHARILTTHMLVAESAPMLDLLDDVTAFADSDQNVLIEGETGVGKEMIAQIMHEGHSRYSAGPFVAVNCGAVPDGLFESLFFGHVRGAFTGAQQAHKGYLEQATGGTLFLDEIGELPLFQQVKLLRVLQDGSITRVGSEAPVQVDFRLIAATNRDLPGMVRQASFRADLYYRLAVIQLQVPNLEQRGVTDKVAILKALLVRILEPGNEGRRIDVPDWLCEQVASIHFAGNVRQLQNLAERIGVIVRQTGGWDLRLINRALDRVREMGKPATQTAPHEPKRMAPDEKARILAELERNGWQRQKTAVQLGISRKSLWEKMRRYGIGS